MVDWGLRLFEFRHCTYHDAFERPALGKFGEWISWDSMRHGFLLLILGVLLWSVAVVFDT